MFRVSLIFRTVAAILPLAAAGVAGAAQATVDQVVSSSGLDPSYNDVSAVTGLLTGDTGYGSGLNPFSPPYDASQILIVNGGGAIVVHLSQAVTTAGRIGVFTNTGLLNTSAPTAKAGSPASKLGKSSMAKISVSDHDGDFVSLFQSQPQALEIPTNYYLDAPVTGEQAGTFYYVDQGLGSKVANQFQPFQTLSSIVPPSNTDPLASFAGKTYPQMLDLLDGSAGGSWFDLSGALSAGLGSVQYIKFDVPVGDRLVLDSISAVPEPTAIATLAVAGVIALRRRH